jgi:hypothetical protein
MAAARLEKCLQFMASRLGIGWSAGNAVLVQLSVLHDDQQLAVRVYGLRNG